VGRLLKQGLVRLDDSGNVVVLAQASAQRGKLR
jgi:hypothetical protein